MGMPQQSSHAYISLTLFYPSADLGPFACLKSNETIQLLGNAREEEEEATTKRLRKSDEKLLCGLRTVMKARGHDVEEIEHLLAHNPDRSLIFDTA